MMELGWIPPALAASLRQLADGRFLRVLALTLGLVLVVTGPFLLVFMAVAGILEWILPASVTLPWVGQVGFLGLLTAGLASKTAWVFWTYVMAPAALAIVGFFYETIVDAVEERHYPGLAPVRHRAFGEQVGYAVRFFFLMIGVSLAALVLSFFSGLFAPMVFVAANGYLIAREYFETVALRRYEVVDVKRLTRRHLPVLWALGALLAVSMAVPFANLLVPIVGLAAFTHLYHRMGGA